jgi:hypothetical protein
MRLSRLFTTLALACALSTTAACGGGDDSGPGALGSTVDPSATTTPSQPVTTPAPTPTRSATSTPTSDQGGDGDSEGDDAPATAGGGICGSISAEQIGAVLGVRMTGSGIPGGGCKFAQGGAHGMTVTVLDKAYATVSGGMNGAKTEATSAVEGEPENLSGIGTAAFVVTGTMFGGSDIQGAGAVHVGARLISIYLVQGKAIPAATVRSYEINLLKLVVRQAP